MKQTRHDATRVWEFRPKPVRGKKRREPAGGDERLQADLGRIPRISRLMALAIKFDGLIKKGVVRDYADLARLGHVTRARMTQIMGLLNLAPDIQEEILFLPRTTEGRDVVHERQVREVVRMASWEEQRRLWRELEPGPPA
jgi:hypothetical protein